MWILSTRCTVGLETQGGGAIPPALCVTNLKPDVVILDEHKKTVHIYELTMPLNLNIGGVAGQICPTIEIFSNMVENLFFLSLL